MANTSSNVLITSSWNNLPNDVINNIFEYWSPKLEQRKQDLEKHKILIRISNDMYDVEDLINSPIIDYDIVVSNIIKYCNMFNRLNDGIYYENIVINDKSIIIYHNNNVIRAIYQNNEHDTLPTKLYMNDSKKLTENTKKRIFKTLKYINDRLINQLHNKLKKVEKKLDRRL